VELSEHADYDRALSKAVRSTDVVTNDRFGSGSAGRVKQQPAIKRQSPYRFEWQFIRERQAVTDDMNVFAHNSNKGRCYSIRGI
jgi:hypothetical protein